MQEIAIYGKGGIGKSTLSANLSAALALSGLRVLQIGCDPKHDSTRLLMHGREIATVLDYLRVTGPADCRLEDVLFTGFHGVGCVEAGGPKPGVGCAGRGIITAFELLEHFRVKDRYDVTLYDVLGDVVCGGFAVPIRREYADVIFLVTSGEYMALYAANNILRGIQNYDGDTHCRVAGILLNCRNVPGEEARVRAFAQAVCLPVCAVVPRSAEFARAEEENRTVVEGPDGPVRALFLDLARRIRAGVPLHPARPLTDAALEQVVLGSIRSAAPSAAPVPAPMDGKAPTAAALPELSAPNRYLSKNLLRDEPLHGCAFNGAVSMSVHLQDVAVLAHAPRSCAYITYQTMSSTGRRRLFERGSLLPVSLSPNFSCTQMGEPEMIFGGMDVLRESVERLKAQRPKAIVVVSSCPAGIIGDDIDQVKALSEPDLPVVTVKADGNLSGDYLQGMLLAYTGLAKQIVRPGAAVVPDTVNVVFEKVVAKNTGENFAVVQDLLARLGVRVNCRFLCQTSYDALANFCSAPLNLLAHKDYTGQILADFFQREYGCRFYDLPFPVGLQETQAWLRGLADFFGRPQAAEDIIQGCQAEYSARIQALRPALMGKRLMIVTYNHELDWLLEAALDAGMELVKIGVLNFSQDEGFRTRLTVPLPVEEPYDRTRRVADAEDLRPDVLLGNYESAQADGPYLADTIPMCPDVGFFSGVKLLERWTALMGLQLEGGWKQDERLFKRYYA